MSFTCPICGRTSYNPSDEKYRYCGACHVFVDDVLDFGDIDRVDVRFDMADVDILKSNKTGTFLDEGSLELEKLDKEKE